MLVVRNVSYKNILYGPNDISCHLGMQGGDDGVSIVVDVGVSWHWHWHASWEHGSMGQWAMLSLKGQILRKKTD